MHAEERHQAILRRLRERGSLRVTEFAEELGVSSVTVRRDVEALAERGLLDRVHGGAVQRHGSREPGAAAGAGAGAGVGVGAHRAPDGSPRAVPADGARLTFGLIVPAADYYYPDVIKGARAAAAARGIRLVLAISQYSPAEEQTQAAQLLDDGVDGLLITPCGPAADQGWPAGLGVPYLLVERRPGPGLADAESVVTDHAAGALAAVRHLAGLGRRRIGLLLREDSPHTPLVEEGYLAGLAAAGLDPDAAPRLRLAPPGTGPAGRAAPIERFTDAVAAGTLDGALVHNDHDAIVLLQRLRARGLSAPDDLAIVAYDDEVAALADIPLTAVAPPKLAVGASAVGLLADRLADPGRPGHRLAILPELRVRESSVGPSASRPPG
ncbi:MULTISPECIES: substrate-binding domain-containing protein [unclassified Streptomyces]|uniref:substrate-binding domain-containing protein n=1 Tax=unclassified Streptomyces TaxID=2593676 RepID=UPI000823C4C4|nr:substrate-binding domain-containing protein [Streptomyces sp. AmelKG-E11A]SCK09428.1 DNA-binding transcriptional regulator, LacI/PurR family [Streptomyces sp. AmelKG-E11A]